MREVMEWQTGRLRSVRDVTPDIRLFEIEPDGKFKTPTPGSHINVTVQIGGRPDVRSYSIVGRVMQFCHGDLSLPCRAGVPATYGNGSVEVRSVIDGGRPDAVWFAACRA